MSQHQDEHYQSVEEQEDQGRASIRQDEDQQRALRRQEQDNQTASHRQMEDEQIADRRQAHDLRVASRRELEDLQIKSQRQDEDRGIADRRRMEDAQIAAQRQMRQQSGHVEMRGLPSEPQQSEWNLETQDSELYRPPPGRPGPQPKVSPPHHIFQQLPACFPPEAQTSHTNSTGHINSDNRPAEPAGRSADRRMGGLRSASATSVRSPCSSELSTNEGNQQSSEEQQVTQENSDGRPHSRSQDRSAA